MHFHSVPARVRQHDSRYSLCQGIQITRPIGPAPFYLGGKIQARQTTARCKCLLMARPTSRCKNEQGIKLKWKTQSRYGVVTELRNVASQSGYGMVPIGSETIPNSASLPSHSHDYGSRLFQPLKKHGRM